MSMDNAINLILKQLKPESKEVEMLPVSEKLIYLPPAQISSAVQILLDAGIWHLSTITCQQVGNKLELLYHFWHQKGLTLRTILDLENPTIKSICPQIPGAEFYEREVRELFGVVFEGLPNPTPLLLPDDWQDGYPMRKENKIPSGEK